MGLLEKLTDGISRRVTGGLTSAEKMDISTPYEILVLVTSITVETHHGDIYVNEASFSNRFTVLHEQKPFK